MRAAAGILCALSLGGTLSQAAQEGAAAVTARRAVEQKALLVQRLLADSPAVKRINESGNEEARSHFAAAARHQSRAAAALQAGDVPNADAQLNEALWMIGKARQLVPDSMKRVIEYRFRYAQLLASVESMEHAYRGHLQRLNQTPAQDASWVKVARMMEQAKTYRTAEQLPEANRELLNAQSALLAALGALLKGVTLDYTPRFSQVSDEFGFELTRHDSYADLVPIALAELSPAETARKATHRHVESSRGLKQQAQQLAAAKNYDDALKAIRAGTEELQRALQSAGLVVPQQLIKQ